MIYLNVLNNLAKYNLVCRVLFIVVVWQIYVVLPNNTSQILGEAVYLGESAGQLFSGKKGKLANTLKKPLEAVLQRGTYAQFFFLKLHFNWGW